MSWPTIRIFVSSTFRDMQAERDHLVRIVFPELREMCRQRQLDLVDVDLRWGVTAREAEDAKALDICLDEIDTCRPYFLGLLGERYGWIPPGQDASITAQEICHGVLENDLPARIRSFDAIAGTLTVAEIDFLRQYYLWQPDPGTWILQPRLPAETLGAIRKMFARFAAYQRDKSYFYFRAPVEGLPSEPYREATPALRDRLAKLREDIVAAGLPCFVYPGTWDATASRIVGLDELGRRVLADLWRSIDGEYPEARVILPPDWLEQEARAHDVFMTERSRRFVGRGGPLARLVEFVSGTGEGPVLVVTGEPGVGKSTLLAHFARSHAARQPEWLVIPHFVGASPASTHVPSMLRRLCSVLASTAGFAGPIPDDPDALDKAFADLLGKAAKKRPILLVIDALDQLEATRRALELRWLPGQVPAGVRIVLSTLAGQALAGLRTRQPRPPELAVGGLVPDERKAIARIFLGEFRKKFPTEALEQAFLTHPATANALYLLVALEELRVFGEYEQIGDRIRSLPADVAGLFETVLARLESMTEFGAELVRDFMVYLASGRHGFAVIELQQMLRGHAPREHDMGEADRLPDMIFARLRRSVSAYLVERSGALDYFHRQLHEAVMHRYLPTDADRQSAHATVANHFAAHWREPNPRAAAELPWQLLRAQRWQDLEALLLSLEFLEARTGSGDTYDLLADFDAAIAELPNDRPRFRLLCLVREALGRDAAFIARHPSTLFQSMWNACWWYDCPEAGDHYVPPQGGWSRAAPPWEGHGERLHRLLESWLKAKRQRHAFKWLRSLRPPALPLGATPQIGCRGHTGGVLGVASDPHGRWVVSAGSDHELKVWDPRSGEALATLRGHEAAVACVQVSRDGRRIVSGARDGTVRVWDSVRHAQILVVPTLTKQVSAVAISPDGITMLGACADGIVRGWDVETGTEKLRLQGHGTPPDGVTFSPDGSRIASAGGHDKTLRIWSAATGVEEHCIGDFERRVSGLAFSGDGTRIATVGNDRVVRVFDAGNGMELLRFSGQEDGSLSSIAFSPDGTSIVTGSSGWLNDHSVRVWNAQDGARRFVFTGHEDDVESVCFAPDGRSVISASADGTVRVWPLASVAAPYELRGHDAWGFIDTLAFSADGRHLATAAMDKTVRVWRADNGVEALCLDYGEAGNQANMAAVFSPDGGRLASIVHDTVRVCDTESGAERVCLRGHSGQVTRVAFLPDGNSLVTGGSDRTVRVWDVHTGGELLCLRGHEDVVSDITCSTDGRYVVSTSFDRTIRVWDTANGSMRACLRGHEKPVDCAVISPDGLRVASRAVDQTVRIWDVASQTEIRRMTAGESGARGLALSRDGRHLISGSTRPAMVRVWDVESGVAESVLEGNCDVEAMAAGHKGFPWRAVGNKLEMTVAAVQTGTAVAWFPGDLRRITTHCGGVTWAGADGNSVHLVRLEMEPSAPVPG